MQPVLAYLLVADVLRPVSYKHQCQGSTMRFLTISSSSSSSSPKKQPPTHLAIIIPRNNNMQNTWPEVPDLGRLRLARIKDVPRMAVVATASFYHSPVFQWERPYHAAHPKSTFESYKWLLAEYIRKPESVVVVAVDEGEPNEDDYTGATIVRDSGDSSATGDKDVIVGLAAYNLLPNTPRLGQFVDLDDKFGHHDRPYLVKGDDADKDIPAIYLLDHVIGPKIDKYRFLPT